ncbi:MAG: Lpg1974 family pore-forming outer membrane protein [Simkaniaceae bacterium]
MNGRWIVYFLLSIMGFAYGQNQKEQPILYYSDDCAIKITPGAGPRVQKSWNPFFTADFIYWTVRQDGMFYAVSGGNAINPSKGSVYEPDWSWDPGFKIGLGFNLPHDDWDIFAQYTWIDSHAEDSVSKNPGTTTLLPYWVVNGSVIALIDAKARWDISYNDLTLEMARNSYLSQYLKLRVHVGFEAAWIYQDYKATLTDVNNFQNRLDLKQDFWGVGLRAGLDTSWQFTKNISFYGDLALATLWGQFDVDRKERQSQGGLSNTTFNTGAKPHTLEPVIAIQAGLRWETWVDQDRLHFLLQAGWEHQVWILHNEVIKNLMEPDHGGDLILQGLTIRGRIDF